MTSARMAVMMLSPVMNPLLRTIMAPAIRWTVYFDDDEFTSRVQDIGKKEEALLAICKDGKVNEEKWVTLRNELKPAFESSPKCS